MLGSQRSYRHDKITSGFVDSSEASGGKNDCQIRLTGIEREYWMDTRDRQIRRLRLLRYSHSR